MYGFITLHVLMSRLVNLTYTDLAPELVYRGSWVPGLWSAPGMGLNGTVHVTNDLAAAVSFTFPVPAVEFYYFGIEQSEGGLYDICTDNCLLTSSFTPVDGFNATDNGMNPPVVLYHESFPLPGIHSITLTNAFDQRGTPPGNSELCVASFVLTVLTNSMPLVSTSPSSSLTTFKLGGNTSAPVPVSPTHALSNSRVLSTSRGRTSGTTTTPTPAPLSISSSIVISKGKGKGTSTPPPTKTSAKNTPAPETAAAASPSPVQLPALHTVVAAVLGGLTACSACILLGFTLVQRWRRRRSRAGGHKRANASTYTSPMAYRPWGPLPPLHSGDTVGDRKLRLALAAPPSPRPGMEGQGRPVPDSAPPRVVPARRESGRARVGRRLGGGFNAVLRGVAARHRPLGSIAETLPEYTDAM